MVRRLLVFWVIALLATALSLLGGVSADATGNSITTPDSPGDVGNYASLALDTAGNPVVSYYDATNGDLKVLHCGNADCTMGNMITSPDTSGNVGGWTSLKLDGAGYPVVSYYDVTNGGLKLLHCGDADRTAGNSVAAPDPSGGVGYQDSLMLDSAGNPVVSYTSFPNLDLMVLHCGNAACTAGNSIASPDPTALSGYTSLALDGTGNPVVSYWDENNGDLKLLHCGNSTCTVGNSITSPDTGANVGLRTSLVLDDAGYPVVSYLSYTNFDLKVLHCGNADCTAGNSITSVDILADLRGSTSLALDGQGKPVISYVHFGSNLFSGRLTLLHCGNADCTAGNTITPADAAGSVDQFNSLALGGLGTPS